MKKIQTEAIIGITVFITICIFVLGLIFLQGKNIRNEGYNIKILFDNVQGLSDGDPVRISGLKVGSVKGMRLIGEKVEVETWITSSVKLPVDSKFIIRSTGVMEERYISIDVGNSDNYIKKWDTVTGYYDIGLMELTQSAATVGENVNLLIQKINTLIDEKVEKDLKKGVSDARETIYLINEKIKKNMNDVDSIITDFKNISNNINIISGEVKDLSRSEKRQISKLLSEIEKSVKSLNSTSESLSNFLQSSENVLYKMDTGRGTLGMLLNDKKLYYKIDKLTSSMDSLVTDIKQNPGRYLKFSIF